MATCSVFVPLPGSTLTPLLVISALGVHQWSLFFFISVRPARPVPSPLDQTLLAGFGTALFTCSGVFCQLCFMIHNRAEAASCSVRTVSLILFNTHIHMEAHT